MTASAPPRPRILLADPDPARRRRLRERVGEGRGTAEAAGPEDALVWLEGQAPGLTVLMAGRDPAEDCQAVARIRELFPEELVVLVTPASSPDLVRAAMRAGAFDLLSADSAEQGGLAATLDAAAQRLVGARA